MTRVTRALSAELACLYVCARLSRRPNCITCPDAGAMFTLCLFVAAWHRWAATSPARTVWS